LKLVVFDCDGTLVDSQHMIVAAMEAAFVESGLPAPGRADTLSVVGLSLDEAMRRLVPAATSGDIAALAQSYKDAFAVLRRNGSHHDALYPGIRETLLALAAEPGVLLGVATGKSRRGLAAVLEREGIADYFVTCQTADTHPSKPNPAMLLAAMTEAGAEPGRTMMIGDTTFDIGMARDAGVRAIGVAWGYHPAEDLIAAGAHRVLSDSLNLSGALHHELTNLD
jgi:phosphoglycolate phosphatase